MKDASVSYRILGAIMCIFVWVTGCSDSFFGYTVSTAVGANGSVTPTNATVASGNTTQLTVTPDAGYAIGTVTGCGGTLTGSTYTTGVITANCTVNANFTRITYTVSTAVGANGSVTPTNATVASGNTTQLTVTPDAGYAIGTVTGCGGTLTGSTYTTGVITANCTVSANFTRITYTVSTAVGANGSVTPTNATVASGNTTQLTVTPGTGYTIGTVTGCGGTLAGSTYTTGVITANCTVSASFTLLPPATAATPVLTYTPIKTFQFTWADVPDATFYRLIEQADTGLGFVQVSSDIVQGTQTIDHIVPLYSRLNARYVLQSCNGGGCTDSSSVSVSGSLASSVGYVKASNADTFDLFGFSVSLSADGNTLAVGALLERSNATGIGGDQNDNSASSGAGAVYVFTRNGVNWSQQAYVKASNTDDGDGFGAIVSLAGDGNTLAVSSNAESSSATGVNGNQSDNSAALAGAVYIYTRNGATWSQQAYVKASNTEANDQFGNAVSLSGDGNTLAVGAIGEDSNATGINGNESDNSAVNSAGAVYIYTRNGATWSQQAYVKASNTEANDQFGYSVSLSGDGNTLAVGAIGEDSSGTGINGNESDNSAVNSAGATYIFSRSGTTWSQQAYVKASNTEANDQFGFSVSLSGDGNTLSVGATGEDSNATGINGNENDNSASGSAGAVYIFTRSGVAWGQQAYVKASNTEADDDFGYAVSLSSDGNTLAVGARWEDSNATGLNGIESDNSASNGAGAVYLFTRNGTTWVQQAYVKASNTDVGDWFGASIHLASDGDTLVVGAINERSNATGLNGDQSNNSVTSAGAVYLY